MKVQCPTIVRSKTANFLRNSSRRCCDDQLEQAGVVGFGMLEHRGVRFQQDVNGRNRALPGREDGLPIVLHADHGPAILLCLIVERLREGAEFGVGQSEAGP